MACKDCHCGGLCKCVGCIDVEISGVTAGDSTCADLIDSAYNRRVTFWRKHQSAEEKAKTPFDLLDAGGAVSGCVDAAEDYPGTLCTFVANLCCAPDSEAEVPNPDIEVVDPEDPVVLP